tara:strand:- start:952 stop:1080 length:129 start_codon:yes stop_codon:yes gene_type:complete
LAQLRSKVARQFHEDAYLLKFDFEAVWSASPLKAIAGTGDDA